MTFEVTVFSIGDRVTNTFPGPVAWWCGEIIGAQPRDGTTSELWFNVRDESGRIHEACNPRYLARA